MQIATKRAAVRTRTLPRIQKDRIVLYLITLVLIVALTWPFLWAVLSSLKDYDEIYIRPPVWLPRVFRFSNYPEVFEVVPFAQFLRNSVIVTVVSVIGQIVSCTAIAYGFARFRFPGRGFLFGVALATLMLPREVTIIPQYLLFRQVGWIDTFLPLTVPFWFGGGGTSAFTIFLMRQYFLTIPYEYDQAAQIDGASSWWILWRVLLPMAKPALATATIFAFLAHWNDFWSPLIFLNSAENYTIPLGLRWLQTTSADFGRPREHLLLAAAIMATMPILILYFSAQKYFVQGIVMSGIKG